MDTATILSHVDHTLLKPESTWEQIKTLCDEAMEFGCATVCIPPSFVKQAAAYVQGNLKICTVIGFPNGYNTHRRQDALRPRTPWKTGPARSTWSSTTAWVKDRQWDDIAPRDRRHQGRLPAATPLKVIIETCLLSDKEKIKLCQLAANAEAGYTSRPPPASPPAAPPARTWPCCGRICPPP